jgi:hypothetical protein
MNLFFFEIPGSLYAALLVENGSNFLNMREGFTFEELK